MNDVEQAALDWIERNSPELRCRWPSLRSAPPETRRLLAKLRRSIQWKVDGMVSDMEGSLGFEVCELFKAEISH